MHGNNMATGQDHNSSKLFQIYGIEIIDLNLAKVGVQGSNPFDRSFSHEDASNVHRADVSPTRMCASFGHAFLELIAANML
jgi:hypothetical protein